MLTQPKRSAVIVIRVAPFEREAIINRARRAGKSVSEFGRGAMMHYASATAATGTTNVPPTVKPTIPKSYLSSSDGRGGA